MSHDTAPEVEARLDALFRARSGSDRVIMACEMFDLARELVAARVRELEPGLSDIEVKIRVFQRMYADDLDAETIARVSAKMRVAASPTPGAIQE